MFRLLPFRKPREYRYGRIHAVKRSGISRNRVVIKLLGVLFLTVILSILFVKRDNFKVSSIKVEIKNAGCADEKKILSVADIKNSLIVLIDDKGLEKRLKDKFSCIGKVDFQKKFPNSLTMKIYGKELVAELDVYKKNDPVPLEILVEATASTQAALPVSRPFLEGSQSAKFLVDIRGLVYPYNDQEKALPIIDIGGEEIEEGKVISNERISKVIEVVNWFNQLSYPINRIMVVGASLGIESEQKVFISLKKDVLRQLASLQLIKQETKMSGRQIEVIDLRFEKPVVVYNPKK